MSIVKSMHLLDWTYSTWLVLVFLALYRPPYVEKQKCFLFLIRKHVPTVKRFSIARVRRDETWQQIKLHPAKNA